MEHTLKKAQPLKLSFVYLQHYALLYYQSLPIVKVTIQFDRMVFIPSNLMVTSQADMEGRLREVLQCFG